MILELRDDLFKYEITNILRIRLRYIISNLGSNLRYFYIISIYRTGLPYMSISVDSDKRVDDPSRAFQRSVRGVVCAVLCSACCVVFVSSVLSVLSVLCV